MFPVKGTMQNRMQHTGRCVPVCLQGHWEQPPFDNSSMRSAYHIRELDVFRLMQLQKPLDVFLSHDWPQGIQNFGNLAQLLQRKPFLRKDVSALCLLDASLCSAATCPLCNYFDVHLAAPQIYDWSPWQGVGYISTCKGTEPALPVL